LIVNKQKIIFLSSETLILLPNLFLDIETVPSFDSEEYFKIKKEIDSGNLDKHSSNNEIFWRFERGGLNPFDGKVILITYKINNAHTFRLKEWELSERELLKKFYNLLVDLQRGPSKDRLRIIGHNILGFDIFFLYSRMKYHKIEEEKWLYQWLINKPEVIDFLQLHLPLNDFKTKGLKHDVLARAYGFPVKHTLGSGEIQHYFQKQYYKIIEYSDREFIYPDLYEKIISNGLISKKTLLDAIKSYEESLNNQKLYFQ